jgi:hypothetical protein
MISREGIGSALKWDAALHALALGALNVACFVGSAADIPGVGNIGANLVNELGEVSGESPVGLGFEYTGDSGGGGLEALPPTVEVKRFRAVITASVESEFSVHGHFSKFGCSLDLDSEMTAVGTVTAPSGAIEVTENPNGTVDVAFEGLPKTYSGIDLSRSKAHMDSGLPLGTCLMSNAVHLEERMVSVGAVTADTIGDCLNAQPEFLDTFRETVGEIVEQTHPDSRINVGTLPPAEAPNTTRLQEEINRQSSDGNSIEATSVADCKFSRFEITSVLPQTSESEAQQ